MSQPQTAILGTGIIGLSTAYFLSLSPSTPPSSIHLIDPSPTLFASASGFAGGFLAEDWFSSDSEALGKLSFRLHRELAAEHGGREKWGYVGSRGFSHSAGVRGKGKKRGEDWFRDGESRWDVVREGFRDGAEPGWLRRSEGDSVESIGEEGSLAQVFVVLPTFIEFRNGSCIVEIRSVSASSFSKLASLEVSSSIIQHEQSPWKKTCEMNSPASAFSTHQTALCPKSLARGSRFQLVRGHHKSSQPCSRNRSSSFRYQVSLGIP